jgi:hypothetical protein
MALTIFGAAAGQDQLRIFARAIMAVEGEQLL